MGDDVTGDIDNGAGTDGDMAIDVNMDDDIAADDALTWMIM